MIVGLGVDVVDVARFERAVTRTPALKPRLFAPEELVRGDGQERGLHSLAARFAAKEAAIKALSLSEAGVDWRDIEVLRREDGSCALALHGKALEAARLQGISGALVSLSHDGEYAAAVVAVLSDSRADGGCEQFTT